MRSTLIGEQAEDDLQGAVARETRGLRRAIVVIAAAVISAAITLLEPDPFGYCPFDKAMDNPVGSGRTGPRP